MKIFVNEQHQIRAIGSTTNSELTEYEINENDFFSGKCDAFILGYCYHVERDDDSNITQTSIYPYIDYNVLEALQNQHEQDQRQITELQLALAEQYEQNLALLDEVTSTQLALTEIYEGMEV